ncbi:organic solute transporter Ostalpha-domain-containing protein [Exophiala viscosa]|uniref:organic solute transporter Ostalpha-domain-containing protein n=1 Tax=Exophiala viscosa TaxID=2486360 RepID=UPI00219A1D98|nr:organic solute transporter Ostalpha-domain-containing protein [Exophiala viscosa]
MGIFDSSSNHTCNMPSSFTADAPDPIVGNLSFHQLNMAISGGCAAFSTLSISILMFRHATHFSRPNEQSKILKICALIPIYSILSFLSIAFPNTYIYLDPWIEFFQGIALGSFFLLLCEFVSPSASSRDVFFAALQVPKSRLSRGGKQPVDGLEWYRKKWFAVFQYPIIALGVAIATDITQAASVYCLESSSIHYSHLWLEIASNVSLSFAITSVVKFYAALKKGLKHHKPLAKFLAFKLIIFLTFLQSIIFWILRSTHTLKGTNQLTWADVNFGIQTMIVCIEMVPFSIFFHWAYDVAPYDLSKARPLPLAQMGGQGGTSSPHDPETGSQGVDQYRMEQQKMQHDYYNQPGGYYGGFMGSRALLTVVNPMEIVRAIMFGFSMRSESKTMNDRYVGGVPPVYQGGPNEY